MMTSNLERWRSLSIRYTEPLDQLSSELPDSDRHKLEAAAREDPGGAAVRRDRDRIVHSTAFRRLMYKTQVLVLQTSDHHRTRLTHTLEVAQISRTIARQLGLNEDLTEAIAAQGAAVVYAEVEPPREQRVRHTYTLRLPDASRSPGLMRAMRRVPGVYDVSRAVRTGS